MPEPSPEPYQLEISVFGPGMGECVVAHIGDGEWIVDSCLHAASKDPIALRYLNSMDVDIRSAVKLVVATHWHDDHIRGLASVLRVAERAKFVDSAAFDQRLLTRLAKSGAMVGANASASDEYEAIFRILLDRQQKGENVHAVGPIRASANKLLLSPSPAGRTVAAEVIALSPSDGTLNRAQTELDEAIRFITKERRRPASRQGPNQVCVALWLKVGEVHAILGADLEHASAITEGWNAIVRSDERPRGRARIFKVPHHGSSNAHSPECWIELLTRNPVAVVTPYSPSKIPTLDDINRLCRNTTQLLLTGDPGRYKVARLSHSVQRTLRENKIKRRALEGKMGHVRIRVDARKGDNLPIIELFNDAERKCA